MDLTDVLSFTRLLYRRFSVECAQPTLFRIGDIVTVQFTVVVVPIKNDRVKMVLQLRAITLVDSTFTQVCLCSNV
jgi:hypothetical protein